MEEGLPEGVTDANQWYTLVASWFSEENKKRSAVNRANAKKKNVFHAGGRRSIARTRKRLKEKLGRTPTRLEVFEANHKRKDGTYINDHAKEFMDKANEMEGSSEEVFKKLAGPEHPGRLRCMGLGPTQSAYFGVYSRGAASGSCSCSCSHSSEDVPTLKGELSEVKKKMEVMARFISNSWAKLDGRC
ncbi:unnamed protein product [Linum tenue]|uniref:Uncharacterized protein n=1 Tax=Linum tenue TaxID=586396 RepID=A0AAV0QY59_9ROSI|nr:unnamed protein product [Linum tenue]